MFVRDPTKSTNLARRCQQSANTHMPQTWHWIGFRLLIAYTAVSFGGQNVDPIKIPEVETKTGENEGGYIVGFLYSFHQLRSQT